MKELLYGVCLGIVVLISCKKTLGSEQKPTDILTAFDIMCYTGVSGNDLSDISAEDNARALSKIDHARLTYSDDPSKSPRGLVHISIMKNGEPIAFTFIAKDGADLPDVQRTEIERSQKFGVGETADFMFSPASAGTYTLEITEDAVGHTWKQNWFVL